MTIDEIIKLIGTQGFAAVVAYFVLVRLEKSIKELIEAVNRLTRAMIAKGYIVPSNGDIGDPPK